MMPVLERPSYLLPNSRGEVVTKISEAGPFWEAEAEDQDYLRHYPEGKNQFSR
jgi:peptide methionine sulfoxide reductase MsrA